MFLQATQSIRRYKIDIKAHYLYFWYIYLETPLAEDEKHYL